MTEPIFLTPPKAADLLQRPKRNVLALCRRGVLGERKLGRLWCIPRQGIQRVFAPPSDGQP